MGLVGGLLSTYPTMLNVVKNEKNRLSPHFFDLIVVDESHRSIYNTYKEIIDYFHTITLGLTATPTDVIDHNTFQIFDCEDGLPSFAYTFAEAVQHIPPYLSSFQVMKIKTKFQDEGISKRTIALEDQKQLMLEGQEIAEITFEGTELEKTVTNKGTNTLIVREFMEECIKDPNGVLPGKTIFFCISKKHARRVEEIFDELYPEYNGELAKVIVSDDPRVYGKTGLLKQFKNNDLPRIAISVDMLDTGIDILEITNLVFAKPVFSYTKFWQMIGRGTRLLNEQKIKPWCTEKDIFLVIDCWDNFEYFKINPKGKSLPVQIPLPVRLFGLRLEKIEAAREKGETDLAAKETARLRSQIATLPAQSVVIMDAGADMAVIQPDAWWSPLTESKIDFLRTRIKPLLRTASSTDFKAMRFEKDILEVSLAHLLEEKEKFDTLKAGIVEEIAELPLSVNTVAKEEKLIRQSQTNHFWATINEEKMDMLVEQLAPLMRFRDTRGPSDGMATFNLKDILVSKEFIEFGPQHESIGIARYREMVEQKVQELLAQNPILQKVRDGSPLNEEEAEVLAGQLHDEHPHITLDLLRRVYNHRQARFLQFIRHILGLETLESFPDTVVKAFEQFIAEHGSLSSRQLQFLELLQEFIAEKGRL